MSQTVLVAVLVSGGRGPTWLPVAEGMICVSEQYAWITTVAAMFYDHGGCNEHSLQGWRPQLNMVTEEANYGCGGHALV